MTKIILFATAVLISVGCERRPLCAGAPEGDGLSPVECREMQRRLMGVDPGTARNLARKFAPEQKCRTFEQQTICEAEK